MHTEEEAKRNFCPEKLILICKEEATLSSMECIASRCMAWRWEPIDIEDAVYGHAASTNQSNRRGYCGLAGRP